VGALGRGRGERIGTVRLGYSRAGAALFRARAHPGFFLGAVAARRRLRTGTLQNPDRGGCARRRSRPSRAPAAALSSIVLAAPAEPFIALCRRAAAPRPVLSDQQRRCGTATLLGAASRAGAAPRRPARGSLDYDSMPSSFAAVAPRILIRSASLRPGIAMM